MTCNLLWREYIIVKTNLTKADHMLHTAHAHTKETQISHKEKTQFAFPFLVFLTTCFCRANAGDMAIWALYVSILGPTRKQ
jgi:hypothetical protein